MKRCTAVPQICVGHLQVKQNSSERLENGFLGSENSKTLSVHNICYHLPLITGFPTSKPHMARSGEQIWSDLFLFTRVLGRRHELQERTQQQLQPPIKLGPRQLCTMPRLTHEYLTAGVRSRKAHLTPQGIEGEAITSA